MYAYWMVLYAIDIVFMHTLYVTYAKCIGNADFIDT